MIKDAEDKGLITPGKVSHKNSAYLTMLQYQMQIFECMHVYAMEGTHT